MIRVYMPVVEFVFVLWENKIKVGLLILLGCKDGLAGSNTSALSK